MIFFDIQKRKVCEKMASEDKKRVLVTLPLEKAEVFEKLAKELGISKSALLALWISEKTK